MMYSLQSLQTDSNTGNFIVAIPAWQIQQQLGFLAEG
jgi:hypothetical protein